MHEKANSPQTAELAYLRVLQLADSALPIGALAHSFGLESLAATGRLRVQELESFLEQYLEEAGAMEAVFCRAGFQLGGCSELDGRRWTEINQRLGALKAGRESRAASAALGHNFLTAITDATRLPVAEQALEAGKDADIGVHHSPAFGLVAAALGVDEDSAALAYLHQSAAGLISACQRLLPLGQRHATRILWNLKPAMVRSARGSRDCSPQDICCFLPMLDWGAMEHPALHTRLFIS